MAPILTPNSPLWRKRLRQASFKGAAFHVEQQGRSSGRRIVVHEYPKREIPYAEDMGRHAMRYQVTGYVIQSPRGNARGAMAADYHINRDRLCAVLDEEGPGELVDPYNPVMNLVGYASSEGPLLFACERYTMMETRERGGVATFEMLFVEAGIPGNTYLVKNTIGEVNASADQASAAAAAYLDQALKKGTVELTLTPLSILPEGI